MQILRQIAAVPALLAVIFLLTNCAGTRTTGSTSTRPAYCCLYDGESGYHVLMAESEASRAKLNRWAETHAGRLHGPSSGVAPRFRLLAVSADMRVLDQMDLYDQSSSHDQHALTRADCAELRSCFARGKTVHVDLASRTVRPR